MKRRFLAMVAALSVAIVSGCSGGQPAAPSNNAQEPAQPPAETTAPDTQPEPATPEAAQPEADLNLAIFEGGFGADFWNEVVKMYEDETGLTVNLQISPNIGDLIRPQIVAGNPPDFMNLKDNDQTGIVAALIKDRGLLELTSVFDGPQFDSQDPLRAKIIEGFLESNKCAPYGDGSIFLAPGSSGPMGLIYNTTLFEEQNWALPVTWDDFFALGDNANANDMSLFTYQGIYPGYIESVLFPALASALGPDYAKIENFTPGIWSDPRTIAVLEQFARIYSDGYLLPGTVALNHTDSQTAQMQNKALFIPNGTWMEDEMADVERAAGYAFGMAPPPVMNANDTRFVAADTEQFSIPAAAAHPEAAKDFLRFLYTDKVIEAYARLNGGAVMATTNALDLVQPYISEGLYGMFNVFNEPGVSALIFGFVAPPEGTKIVYSDEIFNPLSDVMTGNMTAAEWAANIDQAYQDMADGK